MSINHIIEIIKAMKCFENNHTWVSSVINPLHKGTTCECGEHRWLENEENNFSTNYNTGTSGSEPIYKLREFTWEKVTYCNKL